MATGPLAGLRVIELTDDTGRFAGKVLAESGASVAQVVTAPPFAGPAMRDAGVAARGGLLDWWYDGGKQPGRRSTSAPTPGATPTGAWPSAPTS